MTAKKWTGILSAIGMLIFILAPDPVFSGATAGIDICIKTVIPSLLPFFIISSILSNSIQGSSPPWLRPFGRLCGIPKGAEAIILLGVFGGYPVGAKALSDGYSKGLIGKSDANRMLSFCSNAGPSFIFGMTASLFSLGVIPWLLWGIQILSMLLTAVILPNKSHFHCRPSLILKKNPMEQAVKAMASVCGWIIFMRVILSLMNTWIHLPPMLSRVVTGFLELSNGCMELSGCDNPIVRYILIGQFLTFGGLCVILQTRSLIGDLDIRYYIMGKLLQTGISSALLFLSVPMVFPGNYCWLAATACIVISILYAMAIHGKNNTGNHRLYAV